MKRLVFALALFILTPSVFATGEFFDAFLAHYKLTENAAYNDRSCGVCHVSDADFAFNPYGEQVKTAVQTAGTGELTGEMLAALEADDADGDGISNGDEIKNGTFPGDATSGGTATETATKPAETAKKPAPFPPKNGFHPAIVHFPIALFIGGLVLDFLGMIKKDKTLLAAGWYCIIMAAVSAVGAIMSGVLAMGMMKMPYRGLIFEHILYAVGSAVCMFVMVALRVDRHEQMKVGMRAVYYVLAVACLLMISYAGHLGGVFVYGE